MGKYSPLWDYILIDPIEEKNQMTRGGIALPDTIAGDEEQPPAVRGTVMAIGPGAINEDGDLLPMKIEVGMIVRYRPYSGVVNILEGHEYRQVRQEECIGFEH